MDKGIYHIDSIQPDLSPRREILEKIPEISKTIKMYDIDSAFICGLLERFRPKKILEVGVFGGGTTAVILQCMKDLGEPFEMYSVDVAKHEHVDFTFEVGYMAKQAAKLLEVSDYHLYKGKYLPQLMDQIGGGIDFLILDTVHILPGEILDFLVAYPYLTNGAVVCLHDIRQNHVANPDSRRIATNALFNSVAAEKYIFSDPTRTPDYPNTGAFVVNEDTSRYINNVFGILTLSWSSFLDEEVMSLYKSFLRKHYTVESVWIFEHALALNLESKMRKDRQIRRSPLKWIANKLSKILS